MIGYITLGTNDFERACAFYDQLSGSIGDERIMERFREDISVEKSERVRRYTLFALADYYKNRRVQ